MNPALTLLVFVVIVTLILSAEAAPRKKQKKKAKKKKITKKTKKPTRAPTIPFAPNCTSLVQIRSLNQAQCQVYGRSCKQLVQWLPYKCVRVVPRTKRPGRRKILLNEEGCNCHNMCDYTCSASCASNQLCGWDLASGTCHRRSKTIIAAGKVAKPTIPVQEGLCSAMNCARIPFYSGPRPSSGFTFQAITTMSTNGRTLLVGDPERADPGFYVYTRGNDSDATWNTPQRLEDYTFTGTAVNGNGSMLLIGKGNSVTFYEQDEDTGLFSPSMTLPSPYNARWSFGRHLGIAIAPASNVVLIGASELNSARGAAFIYRLGGDKANRTWALEAELAVWTANNRQGMGRSVSLNADGTVALIGCFSSCNPYLYVRNAKTGAWVQSHTFTNETGHVLGQGFPTILSHDGKVAAIGGYGSSRIFVKNSKTGKWERELHVSAPGYRYVLWLYDDFFPTLSADGKTVLFRVGNTFTAYRKTSQGKWTEFIFMHNIDAQDLALNHDGSYLVIAGQNGLDALQC